MGKKLILLLSILMVLIGLSGVYVVGGTQSYLRYQQASVDNQEHCGGQAPVHICVQTPASIFSAFYTSYLATQSSLFTVRYSSSSPMTLFVSITIRKFSLPQRQSVSATATTKSLHFVPPLLNQQVLYNLTNEVNTLLAVQVADTKGHLYYSNDIPVSLHSRWLMQWTTANRLRIAAWITPDDPTVVGLVRKARMHLHEQQSAPAGMIGYAGATPLQVIAQVDALYDALRKDYNIQYVQATVPYDGVGNSSAVTQSIKLPAEVLKQRSGMCIELTALLAAAVERIGLRAAIIIIPGHAFLGVAVAENNTRFEYWDAVYVDRNITADSANVAADNVYTENMKHHTIVDTILVSDARNALVGPML